MAGRRVTGALLIGLLTAAVGCGAGQVADGATVSDTTLVVSADPELRALAAEILPGLLVQAALELRAPVRVEWRTREELESYLRYQVDTELPESEARRMTRAYALLGLVPGDLDLRDLLLGLYLEQVAGFYVPDSTTLFVLSDQPETDLRTVLVHELVHALQDQTVPLDSVADRKRGSDRQTAAQAAIEGHATLVMIESMLSDMQGSPVDLAELPDFAATLGPVLEGARAQYPALAAAPRIIQESLLFPYLAGAGFVQEMWRLNGRRDAPFGHLLPQSTEQIIHPAALVGEAPDPPTDMVVTSGASEADYSDQLGELGTRIFLEEVVGPDAASLSVGWDGDLVSLYGPEETESLLWAIVWDDAGARDRFVTAVSTSAWGRAEGVSVEASEVDGRPLALVSVGEVPAVEISLAPL